MAEKMVAIHYDLVNQLREAILQLPENIETKK